MKDRQDGDTRGFLRGALAASGIVMMSALVVGCAGEAPMEAPEMTEAEEPAGVTIPELPVAPAVSINQVMVASVDHASHALWDAARDLGRPETDEDWRELEHHAIQVAAAGTWIALGGTGQADPGYVQLVGWSDYSQQMTDAAVQALRAAENQDLDAMVVAGDALVETCEACHKEFKPELPSEGYDHPHYIGPDPSN